MGAIRCDDQLHGLCCHSISACPTPPFLKLRLRATYVPGSTLLAGGRSTAVKQARQRPLRSRGDLKAALRPAATAARDSGSADAAVRLRRLPRDIEFEARHCAMASPLAASRKGRATASGPCRAGRAADRARRATIELAPWRIHGHLDVGRAKDQDRSGKNGHCPPAPR